MTTSTQPLRFADATVTYTADQFQGIYRGKQYHAPDFAEVIKRAHNYNCTKMMLTTMTLPGAYQNLEACQQHPETCTMTLGVHPYHVNDIYAEESGSESYLQRLKQFGQDLLKDTHSPLVAFGEIGLDYARLELADKETQQRAFRDQLDLAVEFQLPLFLHARDACEDFINILTPYLRKLPRGGLVHSFAGTKAEMLQLVALGLDISVNGVCFRTDEQLEMVRAIPLERLKLETDAPWCDVVVDDARISGFLGGARAMPGSRKHGKFVSGQMVKGRNESCTIELVARVVAGLMGVEVGEVVRAAWRNSVRMFGLGVDQ
ncbi:deoxyribonuclease TatD [Aspergillus germanicus]